MKQNFQYIRKFNLVLLFLLLGLDAAWARPDSFSTIFKSEKEKVVHIGTTATISSVHRNNPFFNQFSDLLPQKRKVSALGSGFIISNDGYIVTNNHVVEKADKIEITLFNEKTYPAKVIGKDKQTDLALLKIEIEGKNLPVVKMGDSNKVEIGNWVVAIGNPLGLDHTITAGILSARNRDIFNGISYGSFLQTDAAINPGNSGGPLYNMDGEVIGINTAIVAGGQGLGFAIPSNLAVKIIAQLKSKGKVERGWLGVGIQNVSHELAESFSIPGGEKGVALTSVAPDSPAAKGGLKQGDVIIEFAGTRVKKTTELQQVVAETVPGKTVKIKLYRDGKIKYLRVKIGLRDSKSLSFLDNRENEYGLRLVEVTPETRHSLNLQQDYGLAIYEIDANGIAYVQGLREGDVIVEANRKKMTTLKDFSEAVEASRKRSKPVSLLISRAGRLIFVALPIK